MGISGQLDALTAVPQGEKFPIMNETRKGGR